jgi:hypothetical protein
MDVDLAGRLRVICLALPEVTERPSHGAQLGVRSPRSRLPAPGRGWIGVRLDTGVDWAEIGELCHDAHRAVAPPNLTALLDEPGLPGSST